MRRGPRADGSKLTDFVCKSDIKNARLVLRLDTELRNSFIDACQELDTSVAREVRRFIRRFLRLYENGGLDDE